MGFSPPTMVMESSELLLIPEGRATSNATRTAATTYDGSAFILRRGIVFNRIRFRAVSSTGSPTVSVVIYQVPGGHGSGTARLKASAHEIAISGAANHEVTPSEGSVLLEPGLCFVLFGRDSATGNATLRTYTIQPMDLHTANVASDAHPTTFTMAFTAGSPPSTFNPATETTASALDLALTVRLKKV